MLKRKELVWVEELVQLEKENKWPPHLKLRQNKYVNNVIEQDHRKVKWKMNHAMGYQTMWHAWATTTGVEVMHMIQGRDFIHTIFGIAAPNFNDQLANNIVF